MNALRSGFQRAGGGSSSVVPDRRQGAWFRDDFLRSDAGSLGTNGTATNSGTSVVVQGHPGVNRGNVSAAATPDRASYIYPNADWPLGGGVMTLELGFRIPTLSNGVDNAAFRFGWAITANIPTQVDFVTGIYLENDFGAHGNSNNWFFATANASVRTKTDTTIAAVAGAWARLKIVTSADGTASFAYINDVLAASFLAGQGNPPAVGTALTCGMQEVKTLGAGTLMWDWDYIEATQLFTSQR